MMQAVYGPAGEISRMVRAKLVAAGLRPTRQRLEIGALLFNGLDRHFTAEILFEEASALRYPPSLATVYNTLHQFAEHGLVREIAIYGARLWYDTKTGPHFHFYDEERDELFDIPEEFVPNLDIPAPAGMKVESIDVVVRVRAG
jgi:Fur family transcriptional regulator, iron response regulator